MDMPSFIIAVHKNVILVLVIINILVAIFLLILPKVISKVNEITNRWISTEMFERMLNKKIDTDKHILKVRKFIGYASALIAIALLFLYIGGY
jgi:hypothetical protein